jgi:hypothetical protein
MALLTSVFLNRRLSGRGEFADLGSILAVHLQKSNDLLGFFYLT